MAKQKIKITAGTIVHGIGDARPGEILNVEPRVARQLFVAGKAVPYEGQIEKPVTRKTAEKK